MRGKAEARRDAGGPVAVAGAGLTGASWAGLFAAHGVEVRLYDRDPSRREEARLRAEEAARFLAAVGLADGTRVEAGLALLRTVGDPAAAFAGVTLMQECVTEDLQVKRQVFAQAAAHAPAEALLATSSSGLSVSAIQEGVRRPERCLAAHPYNPPHLVPLVELAPGALTTSETLERAWAFYAAMGKEPVVLRRDVPGYIANRLSAALWREAIELVRTGVASVADVDRAVVTGPGLRWAVMGPHLLYHLGGGPGGIRGHLDHLAGVKEGMLRDLATWTTFPADTADVLETGLAAETSGRSTAELAEVRDQALAAILAAGATDRVAAGRDAAAAGAGSDRAEAVVVRGVHGKAVAVAPGATRTTLAWGRRSVLVRFDLEPEAVIPMHAHPHEQTGYLVAGDLTLVGEAGEWALEPGDGWSLPGRLVHGARSRRGAVAVEVFTPLRGEYLPGPPPLEPHPTGFFSDRLENGRGPKAPPGR
ncbi:MAG: 3-hydroxyacyl-CoA dehydrogenase NAD-binding domain-containing protein [Actinobacteria bacterium]|nr:3-hydroxyacyl-CoA dehydrogenase NAD-binding domain-containing protein [Actinomycetota bacterium]